MIRKVLPFKAGWQEAIKPITVEEIKKPELFDGVVLFRFDYETNRAEHNEPIPGLNRTRKTKSIITYDDLNFKNGDRVIIDGFNYSVENVEELVDDKYKSIIARYPNVWKKYSYKKIKLV